MLVVDRCEFDSGYLHRAHGSGHERNANTRAHQVENCEGVVRLINNSGCESGAVAQADAVVVESGRNAAIDKNERLVLNAFHSYCTNELRGSSDGEALSQNLPHRQLRMFHGQTHKADVEPPGDEGFDLAESRHVPNLNFNSRTALAEFEQSARHQTVDSRDADAQAQLAQFTATGSPRRLKCNIDVADDPATVLVEHGASRSKSDSAAIADQQRPANLLLKIPDSLAQRGLGDMKARSCAGEVQLLSQNGKRGEFTGFELHRQKLSQAFEHFIGRITTGAFYWMKQTGGVTSMAVSAYIGIVAAFCTTVAFVPQIVKLRRQGGEDLSYPMLGLYLTGVLLWLVYGSLIHALAVIWANALAALLVAISILLKANPPVKQLNPGTRRLRIAVDMDEVIADSFRKHLGCYNDLVGGRLNEGMVRDHGLEALIPINRRDEFAAIPHCDGFFSDLEVIKGSQEALLELSRHHDIYITSAAMEVPSSFDAKFKWLQTNFPFIPPSRIVFCGDKNIINADVLVDDRSRHFKGFRGKGILFTAPHNIAETAHLRADNWNDVLQILLGAESKPASREPLSRMLSMNPAG